MSTRRRLQASGISLVELVMFIVIVSAGIVGILSVMNYTSAHSADPLVRKQALALAESILEEISMQAYSFCDPDDPAAPTAASAAGCATGEAPGPEAGESRSSVDQPFDNVNDYAGDASWATRVLAAQDRAGNSVAGLEGYSARVTIREEALGGVPSEASLRIDVQVLGPGGADVTLTGYRLRYAPNGV